MSECNHRWLSVAGTNDYECESCGAVKLDSGFRLGAVVTPNRRLGVAVTNGFLVALYILTVVLATAEKEVTDAEIRNTHQRP